MGPMRGLKKRKNQEKRHGENGSSASGPNSKTQAEAKSSQLSDHSRVSKSFDNPIHFGLPSPFNISTYSNGSNSSSLGFNPATEAFSSPVGNTPHEFRHDEQELFERNEIGSSGSDSGNGGIGGGGSSRRVEGGFQIRILSGVIVAKFDSRFYGRFSNEKRNPISSYDAKSVEERSVLRREMNPMEEMVRWIYLVEG
ncbi:unnamed protein product [Lupinus luteus]|uniref:Uncharacterized protein n=1 Tax=Lupinus luteus TaxID=3873 RepID=A0AAV1X5U5_LUPLU